MEKEIFVYENWSGDEPVLIGVLTADQLRGKESYAFQYDNKWLKETANRVLIDPELEFYSGRQYPLGGSYDMFGAFMDSCPDRWGRTLMKRTEARQARAAGRAPRTLLESDYLLGLYDETRMGALRFKTDPDGPFLNASPVEDAVPPMARLREIEAASVALTRDDGADSEDNIAILLAPGSSLGGARPKANVADESGCLWIAKFPAGADESDTEAWEMTMTQLASDCRIKTSPVRLLNLSDAGSTLMIKRFDRDSKRRVHFASAMTMLDRRDRDTEGSSYLDIADFIRMYGASPEEDMAELWRRIVFSMAISNSDDHLRNHGFLLESGGWRLSPIYDINPVPGSWYLSLDVDGSSSEMDLDLAIETSEYYGIDADSAKEYVDQMADVIQHRWRYYAEKNGIHRSEINNMEPAFRLAETWK